MEGWELARLESARGGAWEGAARLKMGQNRAGPISFGGGSRDFLLVKSSDINFCKNRDFGRLATTSLYHSFCFDKNHGARSQMKSR